MTLKNSALLALVGSILATILLVWNFVLTAMNASQGLVPAITLFSSLIYAFAGVTVAVFFYVLHKTQV
jgi:hypothetical protein